MKPTKKLLLAAAVAACTLLPLHEANAWVAAARGGWGGGAVAVGGYRGAYYHGGGCWGCGAAVGAVAGMAVGAAIATAATPAPVYVAPAYAPAPVYAPAYAPTYIGVGSQLTSCRRAPTAWSSTVSSTTRTARIGTSRTTARAASYYEVVPAP